MIKTHQPPNLQNISSDLFYKIMSLNNQKYSHNARKSTSNLLSNELVVIEKKIKENLLDRLKNFHASSMKLR